MAASASIASSALTLPLALLLACNSAPKDTCTPYAHSVVAAATPPASCDGVCVPLTVAGDAGDAGTVFELCTIDCTDGGNAVCTAGTTCVSAAPVSASSYCLFTCGTDDAGNGAGSCPGSTVCTDAGYCL